MRRTLYAATLLGFALSACSAHLHGTPGHSQAKVQANPSQAKVQVNPAQVKVKMK
jgi:hypothetical protein